MSLWLTTGAVMFRPVGNGNGYGYGDGYGYGTIQSDREAIRQDGILEDNT